MRTTTPKTRQTLAVAIKSSGLTTYAWAIAHGVKPGTVYDCLSATQPMSAKRENVVRAILGLPAIEWERIEIEPARQKIVNRQKPRQYRTRQLRLTPEDTVELDEFVREEGYRSFNQWWHATRPQNGRFERARIPQERSNGHGHTCEQDSYDRATTATN